MTLSPDARRYLGELLDLDDTERAPNILAAAELWELAHPRTFPPAGHPHIDPGGWPVVEGAR